MCGFLLFIFSNKLLELNVAGFSLSLSVSRISSTRSSRHVRTNKRNTAVEQLQIHALRKRHSIYLSMSSDIKFIVMLLSTRCFIFFFNFCFFFLQTRNIFCAPLNNINVTRVNISVLNLHFNRGLCLSIFK